MPKASQRLREEGRELGGWREGELGGGGGGEVEKSRGGGDRWCVVRILTFALLRNIETQ